MYLYFYLCFFYLFSIFFFFNDTATTDIYTLSLHDALPISPRTTPGGRWLWCATSRTPFLWSNRCASSTRSFHRDSWPRSSDPRSLPCSENRSTRGTLGSDPTPVRQ